MTNAVLHVLPHPGGGGETYIDMLERMPGFEHRRFYLSSDRTPASALASLPTRWPQLARAARRAALIQTHGDVASMLVLPLVYRRPSIATSHGLNLLRRSTAARRRLVCGGLRAVARTCEAMICSSVAEHDELASVLPASEHDKLRLILNAIDPAPAPDPAQRAAVRTELGADPDTVLGLFAGRLDPNKAPLTAARAAQRVHRQGEPFLLAFAGEGPEDEQLRSIDGHGIRLLGHRDDVPRLLEAADVFIAPSEREGMSYALMEAMAHGLAVVAADSPGQPDAVGEAGVLFGVGDDAALATVLSELIAAPERRTSLGAAARRRALDAFSVERFLAETETVYREVLADA